MQIHQKLKVSSLALAIVLTGCGLFISQLQSAVYAPTESGETTTTSSAHSPSTFDFSAFVQAESQEPEENIIQGGENPILSPEALLKYLGIDAFSGKSNAALSKPGSLDGSNQNPT